MKLSDAIAVSDSAAKIMEKDIPISLAFKLDRVIRKLEPDVQEFFKKRQELIQKNSTPAEDGKTVTLTPEQQSYVNSEIVEMTNQETEFPESLKIDAAVFDKVDAEITGKLIFGLASIVRD